MEIKIGADPELFVTEKHGFHVCATGLVPGTKEKPFPVEKGAIQVDGFALEFNITPAETAEEFSNNIKIVMEQLRENLSKEYNFSKEVSVYFDKHHYSLQSEVARRIGCDPDFNAYTEKQNPVFTEKRLETLRMVGGHVHIGWTKYVDPKEYTHFASCCQTAIQLDYFLACPSILIDKDRIRYNYYGKPGSFRSKPYGCEYRVLSNWWIWEDETRKFIFNQTKKAMDELINNDNYLEAKKPNLARDYYSYMRNEPEYARRDLINYVLAPNPVRSEEHTSE